MKEKLMRFMYGRYGVDSFGKFTVITAIVCAFLATFTNVWIFSLLAWVLLFYTYFRIFSRNTYKRAAENQVYLNKTAKISGFIATQKSLMKQRKTHHNHKCPTCRQKIRVPRGKGKIEIRCPKCQTTFIKRS